MHKLKRHFLYIRNILLLGLYEKPQIWLSVILSILGSVVEISSMLLIYPLAIIAKGEVIDESSKFYFLVKYIGNDGRNWLLLFLLLLLLRLLVTLAHQAITLKLGRDLLAVISSKIFRIVVKNVPLSEITKNGIGHYTSISGDEAFRASMTIINLTQFFNLFILTFLYYASMALYSFNMFFIITAFLLICFGVMFRFFKKIQHFGIAQAEQSRETGLMFIDSLNNVKSIRCYNGEEFVTNDYFRRISNYTKILFWVDFYQVMLKIIPIILLVVLGFISVNFVYSKGGAIDLVFCVTLLAYLTRFFPSLGQCLNIFLKIIGDSKSGKDILSLLNTPVDDEAKSTDKSLNDIENIKIQNISFSFDQNVILDNFSYRFEKGRRYGVLGPSGVGKSTLIDLVLNFYVPKEGSILINDIDAIQLNSSLIRSKIILMEQRVTIFQASIFQNITLGADYSLEEVREACKLVRIDEYIETLPEKYETSIQYMGANLSGGQRQRVAMARAILRKPEVLILDESLSALDSVTKEEIFSDLCNIFKDRILIIIAHDYWIISQLDNVIDFNQLDNYKKEL